MELQKHIIECTRPLVRRVRVGILAGSPEHAERKARRLFDQGELLADGEQSPVLLNECSEAQGEAAVEFKVVESRPIAEKFPPAHPSVRTEKKRAVSDDAYEACQRLLAAMTPRWGPDLTELTLAIELARKVVPREDRMYVPTRPRNKQHLVDDWLEGVRSELEQKRGK